MSTRRIHPHSVYVCTNATQTKIGIAQDNGRKRLREHVRNGFTPVCIWSGFTRLEARSVELLTLRALRIEGYEPIGNSNEYFPIDTLGAMLIAVHCIARTATSTLPDLSNRTPTA